VLALYLVDVSDLCQQQGFIESAQQAGESFNSSHFYKMVTVFVQLYRSCLNEFLLQMFEPAYKDDKEENKDEDE
jgi:hypothetical protein